jgi:hypothetical protein
VHDASILDLVAARMENSVRVHFIELHEQPLLPATIRDEVLDAMQFGIGLLRVYDPVLPILRNLIDSTGSRRIVDLGSGAGGPWFSLARKLEKQIGNVDILLTDKFPNFEMPERLQALDAKNTRNIGFCPTAVDALHIPGNLMGLRTMFSSFHHFAPDDARAVLQNAVDAREGICVFEVSRRDAVTIALMFPWALLPFFFTPWIRPFRWSRLFWTYILPIIPLILLVDGLVSCLRSYRPRELREIIKITTGAKYKWRIQEVAGVNSFIPVCCLTGYPET